MSKEMKYGRCSAVYWAPSAFCAERRVGVLNVYGPPMAAGGG